MFSFFPKRKELCNVTHLLLVGVLLVITGFYLGLCSFISGYAELYPLNTGDYLLYERAGKLYLHGVAPSSFNPEHPPLAKYIIGLCVTHSFGKFCPALAVALGVLGFGFALWLLTGSVESLVVFLGAVLFEPLFVSLGLFNLLDPYMFMFVGLAFALSIYAETRESGRALVLGGLFWGAAIASKLPALYPFLGVIMWYIFIRRRPRRASVILALASLVYVLSFMGDLIAYGFKGILLHHEKMYEIMKRRHGFGVFLAVTGLVYFALQIEIWRYLGNVTLYVKNNTIISIKYSFLAHPEAYVIITPYMHNYLHLYAVVFMFSLLLGKDKGEMDRLVGLVALSSLLMTIYGPIWWYLVLPSVACHFVLAYTHKGESWLAILHLIFTALLWIVYGAIGIRTLVIS